MNRVQREKAGWRFTKGKWRWGRNRRAPATAPADNESHREAGDMERGPDPPPELAAEPAPKETEDEN